METMRRDRGNVCGLGSLYCDVVDRECVASANCRPCLGLGLPVIMIMMMVIESTNINRYMQAIAGREAQLLDDALLIANRAIAVRQQ